MITDPAQEIVDLIEFLKSLKFTGTDTIFDVISRNLHADSNELFYMTSELVLNRLRSLKTIAETLLDGNSPLPAGNIENAISAVDRLHGALINPTTRWNVLRQNFATDQAQLAIGALVPDLRTKFPLPLFDDIERQRFIDQIKEIRAEVTEGEHDWFDHVLNSGLARLQVSIENFQFFGIQGVCDASNLLNQSVQSLSSLDSGESSETLPKTREVLKELYKILIIPPAFLAAVAFYGSGISWVVCQYANNAEAFPRIEAVLPKRIEGPKDEEE